MAVAPGISRAEKPSLPATLPEDLLPGLRDILHSALRQSPQMIARQLDLASQEANRYQQDAALWPSLSAGVNYSYNQTAAAQNSITSSSRNQGFFYSSSLSQPIYHWGALRAAADIANLQIKMSERQYADAYRQLALTLRSQYLSLITEKVVLRNARYSLEQAKTLLAVTQEKFKHGDATQNQVSSVQAQVNDANLTVDRAAEDFFHVKRVLLLTAGLPKLDDEAIPDDLPKPIYKSDVVTRLMKDFAAGGVDDTFQAEIYDYQIQQAKLNYKIARYRLYPRFDVQLGASLQNQTNVVGSTVSQSPVFYENASVGASWTIFDGFATRGAKMSALASKRAAEENRRSYVAQTVEQAQDLVRQLDFAARSTVRTDEIYDSAAGSVQQAKDNLKLGVGSQAEVDLATAVYYQWQLQAISARATFFQHWGEYISLLGVDPVLNNLPARFITNAK